MPPRAQADVTGSRMAENGGLHSMKQGPAPVRSGKRSESVGGVLLARTPRPVAAPPAPALPNTMALVHTCCVLAVALGAHSLPGRAPKVYNALITSGQNLSPSKSFPIYQPVYRDAYGFPLSTFYYDDDFKSFFSEGLQPRQLGSVQGLASGSDIPNRSVAELVPSADAGRRQSADEAPLPPPSPSGQPQEESSPGSADPQPQSPPPSPGGQPPPPPATKAPIPLNEFGLPPAIVPLGGRQDQPRPAPAFSFDPFAHFSPYYPQFNPYSDPYSFQSYPLLPPLYRFHGEALPQPAGPAPAPAPAPTAPAAPPSPPPSAPPSAPADLELNNYRGKDRSIPDVPPPPLPSGGLKNDNAKTN